MYYINLQALSSSYPNLFPFSCHVDFKLCFFCCGLCGWFLWKWPGEFSSYIPWFLFLGSFSYHSLIEPANSQGRRRADMAKTEIPVQEGKVCMKEKSGIRTPSAVRLALEFDGLNYFETLVSHWHSPVLSFFFSDETFSSWVLYMYLFLHSFTWNSDPFMLISM